MMINKYRSFLIVIDPCNETITSGSSLNNDTGSILFNDPLIQLEHQP